MQDLLYWKAAEFRLFMLYAGCVILKDKNTMEKKYYQHFIKFVVAMRFLLNDSTAESDLVVVTEILQTFVAECTNLYGVGFISYNVHSLLHLVDDYKMYGCLDGVSCFPFESCLGLLKNSVHSGHKPFQQVCKYVFHQNSNALVLEKKRIKKTCNYLKVNGPVEGEGLDLPASYSSLCVTKYKKAVLQNECIIKPSSLAD